MVLSFSVVAGHSSLLCADYVYLSAFPAIDVFFWNSGKTCMPAQGRA